MSEISLDYIQSTQAGKEQTANALIRAGQQSLYFGVRESMTGLLSFGIYGALCKKLDGSVYEVLPNQFTLQASAKTCISFDIETAQFNQNINTFLGGVKLYEVTTNSNSITDIKKWYGATENIDLLSSQGNADWNATSGPQEILNKPDLSVYLEATDIIAGTNVTLDKVGNSITINASSGSTLQPASDTVLGGVKIPLDSQIYIDSNDNIYLRDTQSIVVDAGTGPFYTPTSKSVIWKINNTSAYTVYLPNSAGLVEENTIIEYFGLGDGLITFNIQGTDTINGFRVNSVSSITSLNYKGRNKGLFRFMLTDKTAKKWSLIESNDSVDIQNQGITISSSIDKINFNDSFTVTETSPGEVTIETTHNKLTVKDEGVDLSTNVNSINFVGAGVTTTHTGNDVTVTINGGGGGGSGITIKDEGVALTTDATTLNFEGSLVTASGTGTEKTITINNNYVTTTLSSDYNITGGVNTLFTQIAPFNTSLLANGLYEIDFFGSIMTSTTAAGGGYAMNFFCTDANAVVSGSFETYGVSAAHNSYLIPSAAYTSTSNPLKAVLNGNGELPMSGISTRQNNNPMIVRLRGYIKPTVDCTFYIKARTSDTANPTTVTATLYTGATLIIKKI